MNLLYDKYVRQCFIDLISTSDEIYFHNYREYEYENKLEKIIKSLLDFLKYNTIEDFDFNYDYSLKNESTSYNYNYSEFILLTIRYSYKYKKEYIEDVLKVRIPKLVDKHFFYLRDNIYVPVIKLKDRAIRFGPERIIIEGLHSSLIIDYRIKQPYSNKRYFDPNDNSLVVRVATKRKIPIWNFFYELYKDSDQIFLKELSDFLDFDLTQKPKRNQKLTTKFLDHLNILDQKGNRNLSEILDKLYFTDFNLGLYEYELGFRPESISYIIKFIFRNFIFKEDYKYVNLKNLQNRRFIFLEDIIRPFARAIFEFLISISTSSKGLKLSMNRDKIVSMFMAGDIRRGIKPGKYVYDYGSVYTGVKANIAIQMEGEVKKFMRSLDPSFRNIICPISTSSSEPGVQIHVNPKTKLSPYGHIINRFKSLKE